MLENMGGEDGADGALTLRQIQSVDYGKLHIVASYRVSSASDHMRRHVDGVYMVKRHCKLFRKPPCAASNLQAVSLFEAVLLPVTLEIQPIGFSESIELFFRPR